MEGTALTNNQAEAYAKLAMRGCNVDEKTIEQVLAEMKWLFDTMTEEQVCVKMFGCRS